MKPLIIIAQSAQMLAQAACHIGLNVITIDCFADQDTQALAVQSYRVDSLAINALKNCIDRLENKFNECLYGSGFELYPESLIFLETRFKLIGNSSRIFNALQNKHQFFKRLQALTILFPPVFFPTKNKLQPKFKTQPYLIKPHNNVGGMNIHSATTYNVNPLTILNYYYQKKIAGQAMSALFAANGQHALIMGFNQQWSCPNSFVFSGIMNHTTLSHQHRNKLHHWINRLTKRYQLRGLCSLDFIFYRHHCYVLEINPRPPASMALYPKNLLNIHLLACQGQLDKTLIIKDPLYRVYQIIYSHVKLQIPPYFKWADYCCNLPAAGMIIGKGEPICSMIISGKNPKRLLDDLNDKQLLLFTQISEIT
ncbi:MAG: ATP-grasp domain-containing protein [Methylococcales bacterium]|nr:ATP-grasp domain-containing protein [Methylococcales bacterium]